MNTAIGSVSALLSQNKINRSEDAEDIPQGVLLLGDSMVRNIRPEYIPDAMVIKFAYPGITGKQLQNQFKELFLRYSKEPGIHEPLGRWTTRPEASSISRNKVRVNFYRHPNTLV